MLNWKWVVRQWGSSVAAILEPAKNGLRGTRFQKYKNKNKGEREKEKKTDTITKNCSHDAKGSADPLKSKSAVDL
jgi:hypothetical protein